MLNPPKGRSLSRVLYAIETYCRSYHRLSENCQVGDGLVTYYGKTVATYSWDDEDTPVFEFHEFDTFHQTIAEGFTKDQFFKRPFLDSFFHTTSINYVVQEVRKELTFSEALAIRHIRDRLDGEWNNITVQDSTVKKIKDGIHKHSQGDFSVEDAEKYWQHIAMCTIYDI